MATTDIQKKVEKDFNQFKWDNIKIKNLCDTKQSSKISLNNTQQFVTEYVNPENDNGILLWHSVGSGKTLSAVSIIKKFEDKGYNALWVTRTTLKKDLDKALAMIPLKQKLTVVSYKQFSNITNKKGANYEKIMAKAKKLNKETDDPIYKTIVIIDECHKLFTKDLKPQEMHDISSIQKAIYYSYKSSEKDSVNVVLMSATPITEDPIEVIKLFNIIIKNPEKRFDISSFKKDYLTADGEFTKKGLIEFKNNIKDLVSYIDMSKDPRKFAQINYKEILVPMSIPEFKQNFEEIEAECKNQIKFCKEFLKYPVKECNNQYRECINEIKKNKKIYQNGKFQNKVLKERCSVNL